jgi:hypothetical protein
VSETELLRRAYNCLAEDAKLFIGVHDAGGTFLEMRLTPQSLSSLRNSLMADIAEAIAEAQSTQSSEGKV